MRTSKAAIRCALAIKSLIAALGLCVCTQAWPLSACDRDYVDVPKERVSATAASVANLRGAPGSLKAELSRLLSDAREDVAQATPRAGKTCSQSCTPVGRPRITLSVIPNKYLKSYGDEEKCAQRLTQTSLHPLKFGPRRSKSEKELGEWISEVSQGNGKDGKLLYQKCGGKCSPRYFIDATQDGNELVASISVVCGPARDKDDNTYTVSSGYRWGCHTKQ